MSRPLPIVLVATIACGPADPAPLVDPTRWEAVDAADDPFRDRPEVVRCDADAWTVEELDIEATLGIDTGDCDYLVVAQPLLAEVSRRDELFMRLWHFELTAPAPAEAHVALWAAGTVIWQERIAIPAASDMIAPRWEPDVALEAGETLMFHLHNHGINSWNLIEISRNPEPAAVL